MIRKSVLTFMLAASLASPSLLLAPAAFASESAHAAVVTEAPSNPTLLWTGGRSVLVTWGEASDGARYEVSIAGGDVQRTKTTESNSATFSNLPLNHRYMASVVTIDASGQRSEAALTNRVGLGTPPASEAQATPTPRASAQPSSTPSESAQPSPTAMPSRTPSVAPTPSQSPSEAASTPASTPSASPTQSAVAIPGSDDQSLISQVHPYEAALGALVALLTFGGLLFGRRAYQRKRA